MAGTACASCTRVASRSVIVASPTRTQGLATSAVLLHQSENQNDGTSLMFVPGYKNHPLPSHLSKGLRHHMKNNQFKWSSGIVDIALWMKRDSFLSPRYEVRLCCALTTASIGFNSEVLRVSLATLMRLCLQYHKHFSRQLVTCVRYSLLSAFAAGENLSAHADIYELCSELRRLDLLPRGVPGRRESIAAMISFLGIPHGERAVATPPVIEGMVQQWSALKTYRHDEDTRHSKDLHPMLLREAFLASPFMELSQFVSIYRSLRSSVDADCKAFQWSSPRLLRRIPSDVVLAIVQAWCRAPPRSFVNGHNSMTAEELPVVVNAVLCTLVRNGVTISSQCYEMLLDECWVLRSKHFGLLVYRSMREQGIQPTDKAFGRILRLCLHYPVTVKWLWEDVCREFHSCPPVGMFHYLMEALAVQNKTPAVIPHVHNLLRTRARLCAESLHQSLDSPSALLWSFYAATLCGSADAAFEHLDLMVGKNVMPDISVLTLMWKMVRSKQDFAQIIQPLLERMIRWRVTPTKEFVLEGLAAMGQLSGPVFFKSNVYGSAVMRTDLMPVGSPTTGGMEQDNEERLLIVLLAISQQVHNEILSTAEPAPELAEPTVTVTAEELKLEDGFYSASALRPGADGENLTAVMRNLMFPADGGMPDPVFLDSSLESCVQNLQELQAQLETGSS